MGCLPCGGCADAPRTWQRRETGRDDNRGQRYRDPITGAAMTGAAMTKAAKPMMVLLAAALLSPSPNVLLAQNALGASTLQALLALAKARAGNPLSYASVGRGSAHHFCMELLKSEAGIDLLHVPYRGVAPAVLAVTRGEVDLY